MSIVANKSSLKEKGIAQINELVAQNSNKAKVLAFMLKNGMVNSDRTWRRWWNEWESRCVDELITGPNSYIAPLVTRSFKRSNRVHALADKEVDADKATKMYMVCQKIDEGNVKMLQDLGILKRLAEKIEHSGVVDTGNVLKVVFPEGFKMPKKDDIK